MDKYPKELSHLRYFLGKLNRHYNHSAKLCWVEDRDFSAYHIYPDFIIIIRGPARALHPQILAHEYAHSFYPFPKRLMGWDGGHTRNFFRAYREVCTLLSIPPLCNNVEQCKEFTRQFCKVELRKPTENNR